MGNLARTIMKNKLRYLMLPTLVVIASSNLSGDRTMLDTSVDGTTGEHTKYRNSTSPSTLLANHKRVYLDRSCSMGGEYMELCDAYQRGYRSFSEWGSIDLGDFGSITGNFCIQIPADICIHELTLNTVNGFHVCSASQQSIDEAAVTELTSIDSYPYESGFAIMCGGNEVGVAFRKDNKPPWNRASPEYKKWDPCKHVVDGLFSSIAFGHTHPYFGDAGQMNAGQGCRGIRNWTDGNAKSFNLRSWKFSKPDRDFVKNYRRLLYLINSGRGIVRVMDVTAAYTPNSQGRLIK